MDNVIGREVLDMEILVWGIVQKVEGGLVYLKSEEFNGEWATDIDNVIFAVRMNGAVDIVSLKPSTDDIPF